MVQKNIWKRVKTRFLDIAYLPSIDEQKILAEKEFRYIRQEVEEQLALTYQGIKIVSPSGDPRKPYRNNAGGAYILDFLDENGIEYHIVAFLNSNRDHITAIRVQTTAAGRDKFTLLQDVCDLAQKRFKQN